MYSEIIQELKDHRFHVEDNKEQVDKFAMLLEEIANESGSDRAFLSSFADMMDDVLSKIESKNPDFNREYLEFTQAFEEALKEWPTTAIQIGEKSDELRQAMSDLHEVEVADPYNGMPGESYDFYQGITSVVRSTGMSISRGRGR